MYTNDRAQVYETRETKIFYKIHYVHSNKISRIVKDTGATPAYDNKVNVRKLFSGIKDPTRMNINQMYFTK